MNKATVIVGAGISGLLLARRLRQAGANVVVLEKSRGFGGRMATKRAAEAVFDQGAQFFTVSDPVFAAMVDGWCAHGVARRWPGSEHRYIGVPSMTAIPKLLAEEVKVLREHKVSAVRRHECGCWELDVEDHEIVRAERVLLTSPVQQSLGLLRAGGMVLPPRADASLRELSYHACLALLLTLDGPSEVPAEGIAFEDGPVRWMADNTKKGVAPGPAAVTVHASADFSEKHYGASAAELAALLLPVVRRWLGSGVTSTTLHRWRFSEPKTFSPERCLWLPEIKLGFAGDAFGGPKIEGAALSGLALGEKIAGTLSVP